MTRSYDPTEKEEVLCERIMRVALETKEPVSPALALAIVREIREPIDFVAEDYEEMLGKRRGVANDVVISALRVAAAVSRRQ